MGLDSYFQATKETKYEATDSISEEAYFRGNMYYRFIKELCGINIYQEWTSPNEVREVSDALYECLIAKPGTEDYELLNISEFSRREIEILLSKFMYACMKGHGLYGSF